MPRVVIFVDQPDWHSRRLKAAFAARGADTIVTSLRECHFRIGGGAPAVAVPGLDGALPDAVLVKTIAGGSFEQVTLRLSILHALDAMGVPVINTARAIERCVDKSMTSFLLARAGIPTPPTLVAESDRLAERLLAAAPGERVLKPLFGSRGRGLARLAPGTPLPPAEPYAGVRYLQDYIDRAPAWHDYRVLVVGREPVAAMIRHGKSWITNVGNGARCEAVAAEGRLGELALAAAAAVGADYAGIDLIETRGGEFLVLEANSMPAWKGLQGVSAHDIAARIADHVLARAA